MSVCDCPTGRDITTDKENCKILPGSCRVTVGVGWVCGKDTPTDKEKLFAEHPSVGHYSAVSRAFAFVCVGYAPRRIAFQKNIIIKFDTRQLSVGLSVGPTGRDIPTDKENSKFLLHIHRLGSAVRGSDWERYSYR